MSSFSELVTSVFGSLISATLQTGLLTVTVLTLLLLLRRRISSPVRYGLLLLVLVKFAMPPHWTLATGVFSSIDNPVQFSAPIPRTERDATLDFQTQDAIDSQVTRPDGHSVLVFV